MVTQLLNPPIDITWRRLARVTWWIRTSWDLLVPPKWRSSLAVYDYVVPEEQTAESYANSRIVYLQVTCSVTGWNPSEELRGAVHLEDAGEQLDDLQRSTWQAIRAEGRAEQYWPSLGAIVQIAVYPSEDDGEVSPNDFPFFIREEPKQRELYETRSETGESKQLNPSTRTPRLPRGP
jgi:hypothetical protein